jgi:hypothetical protein
MTIQLIDRYLQLIDASKHELQLIGSTGMNQKSYILEKIFQNRTKKYFSKSEYIE